MATNRARWVKNLNGAQEPLVMLGLFQAGVTNAVKRGELLEFTYNTNAAWGPMDSDYPMEGNVAIANEEIKSGDRAGYYEIIVPRPGDVFEYDLDTPAATVFATPVYYSSSEAVSASGTNVLGLTVGMAHYPDKQGHLADDASGDAGSTVRSCAYVHIVILERNSLYGLLTSLLNELNIGDAGGFCGIKWDGSEFEIYGDATQLSSIHADGTYNDDVGG